MEQNITSRNAKKNPRAALNPIVVETTSDQAMKLLSNGENPKMKKNVENVEDPQEDPITETDPNQERGEKRETSHTRKRRKKKRKTPNPRYTRKKSRRRGKSKW